MGGQESEKDEPRVSALQQQEEVTVKLTPHFGTLEVFRRSKSHGQLEPLTVGDVLSKRLPLRLIKATTREPVRMSSVAAAGPASQEKDVIPPVACRPPYTSNYSILGI